VFSPWPDENNRRTLVWVGLLLQPTDMSKETPPTMNKEMQAISNDVDALVEDARALMSATADVAGDKVGEARRRLRTTLENSKEFYGRMRVKAVEGARAADKTVHEHPYQAIGIAFGVGALLGYLSHRRDSRNGD